MVERDYMRRDWSEGDVRRPFWATYPGTKGIMIGLAAIHLFLVLLPDQARLSAYLALSLQPDRVLHRFHVWQLFTYALLHANAWHLAWNVLAFWFFGRIVEQRLGLRRYLQFCAGGAIFASLVYLAWGLARSNLYPMLGASGADMAVLLLVTFWMPRLTILAFFIIPMPLWVLSLIWVFMDFTQAMEGPGGGIAASAHLGGALFGFLYYRYSGKFGRIFSAIDDMAEHRRQRKDHETRENAAELRREVDRILDKVNREGMRALTAEERKFLKRASEKLR